ncbi:winged helix-turn-helix transcriptional regulator [Halobaculum lipolyticum]
MNYARKVPKEIRLAVEGLHGQNDLRFAVIIALLEGDNMKFTDLKETLEVHQQTLSNALDGLQTAGIIKKEADGMVGGQQTGQYVTTEYGKQILDGFYAAMKPKRENVSRDFELTPARNVYGDNVLVGGWNVTGVSEREVVSSQSKSTNVESFGRSGTYGSGNPGVPS